MPSFCYAECYIKSLIAHYVINYYSSYNLVKKA